MKHFFARARKAIACAGAFFVSVGGLGAFAGTASAESALTKNIPALNGRSVVDTAHILSASEQDALNTYLIATSEQTGVQVAVLTVPSLQGYPIEELSMAAAEAWGLGQKGADNGVLLTVAMEEHDLRIEVGYGLEEKLTDTKCGLIIRGFIAPAFKTGDHAKGITTGIEKIVGVATDNAQIDTELKALADDGDTIADILIPLIMFAVFFGIVLSSQGYGFLCYRLLYGLLTGTPVQRKIYKSTNPNGHDPYRSFTGSGHSGRSGGFGGTHGGGSHFSGGGGHFGGGGASGKW